MFKSNPFKPGDFIRRKFDPRFPKLKPSTWKVIDIGPDGKMSLGFIDLGGVQRFISSDCTWEDKELIREYKYSLKFD